MRRAIVAGAALAAFLVASTADVIGQVAGGTEIRNLVAHGGRLFASDGYWKDMSETGE